MDVTTTSAAELTTDYLQLFVTQIQNQNPLEPIEQDAFLSQLAQFTMVEGIENIGSSLEGSAKNESITQGINLVGKGVSYQSALTEDFAAGTVDEVFIERDGLTAVVNGESVPFSQISSVFINPEI